MNLSVPHLRISQNPVSFRFLQYLRAVISLIITLIITSGWLKMRLWVSRAALQLATPRCPLISTFLSCSRLPSHAWVLLLITINLSDEMVDCRPFPSHTWCLVSVRPQRPFAVSFPSFVIISLLLHMYMQGVFHEDHFQKRANFHWSSCNLYLYSSNALSHSGSALFFFCLGSFAKEWQNKAISTPPSLIGSYPNYLSSFHQSFHPRSAPVRLLS